jgi:toluene monooxygenase system ferredoxin subunit
VTDGEWVDSIAVDQLWEGDMVGVDLGDTPILLVNFDGKILAYENRCPHQASPLSEGDLDDNVLTCSRHLWCFDVTTGQGINPANARLKEFEAKVEGDRILVRLVSVST